MALRRLYITLVGLLTVWSSTAASQEHECSTETVNGNCTLTLDRSYAVVTPTIQMRPGAKVTVKVAHSLPYEALTLELQSTQAASGTDQTAAFVTAAMPNLKGLLLQTSVNLQALSVLQADPSFKATDADSPGVRKFKDDSAKVAVDILPLFLDMQFFASNAIVVYGQLNEVLGTIPPVLLQPEKPASQSQNTPPRRLLDSAVEASFPRPWRTEEYDNWRSLMRCELAAVECPTKDQPKVNGLLSDGAKLATALGACLTCSPKFSPAKT